MSRLVKYPQEKGVLSLWRDIGNGVTMGLARCEKGPETCVIILQHKHAQNGHDCNGGCCAVGRAVSVGQQRELLDGREGGARANTLALDLLSLWTPWPYPRRAMGPSMTTHKGNKNG